MQILPNTIKTKFYQALINNNSQYEGIFYVSIKTTGMFCRSTCSAQQSEFKNCEFYSTIEEALLMSFISCHSCLPFSHPNYVSNSMLSLVKEVEGYPEKRWKSKDCQQLAITVKHPQSI